MDSDGSGMVVASSLEGLEQKMPPPPDFGEQQDDAEMAALIEHFGGEETASFAAKQPKDRIPNGTHVTWHYRSAIGHGTVVSIAKPGKTSAKTLYNIREIDHHVSAKGSKEPGIVQHYGSALTRSSK